MAPFAMSGLVHIVYHLATSEAFPYIEPMEVHFTPDVEKKLNELAAQSGRGTDELLQDALAAYFDELVRARHMLDSRYDDLKSGRVKPIDGEEAFARLREKTEAQRNRQA
jgi:hypothetical protein